MKLNRDRNGAGKTAPRTRGRFRIDKLEERIAPKGLHKGTKNQPTAYCGADIDSAGCGSY